MFTSRRLVCSLFVVSSFLSPSLLPAQRIISTLSNVPAFLLALDPVTDRIYVADQQNESLDIVDGATNQLLTTVNFGSGPLRPVVNSTTNKIYVPIPSQNVLKVVDGSTFAVATVNVGVGPSGVGVNATTNKIYVANADDNTVTVIDGVTLGTTTVPVDEGPLAVAVNPLTNKIYVGNQRFVGDSTVTVIDGATNHTTTIDLGFVANFYSGSDALLVNPANNQIYALGYVYLYDIDGATNSIINVEWDSFGCINSIALNTTTGHVYGPDPCTGNIDDVPPLSGIANLIYNGFGDEYISVDSVKNRLYVADSYYMTVLDLDLGTITDFTVGVWSENLVTNSATNTTYFGTNNGFAVFAGATPMQFVAAAPCRVIDTRTSGGPIQGGSYQTVSVPASSCNIPASAAAYSLNVTLVPVSGGPVSYLTVWPTDQLKPIVSTMNSLDGRVKADAAIVAAGTLGGVNVYVSNTTNVLIDINGYFITNGSSTLAFYPLTPCRVFDTRNADGDLGGPYLSGGVERDFPILESSCIPSGVTPQAYSLNFTALPHESGQSLSYLTVWPQGQTKPLVSTLNNPTATIVANAAMVPAGQDGKIAVFPSNETDLVGDINGYFAAPGTGGLSLYSATPCRVLDTRQHNGAFEGELTVRIDSTCYAPAAAQAYVFNATVVPSGPLGFLTLYPDGQNRPLASTLNAIDGAITSNMAIVPSTNGSIDAYASGLTQLILDISSYFAP
jgi:YVTN family beta-propeller protein